MKMRTSGLLAVLLICAFCSCSKTNQQGSVDSSKKQTESKVKLNSAGVKESGTEFTVQYEQPRQIYKIEKEDLNNDGIKEVIVLSVLKDTSEKYNEYYNFDMVEVFALDSVQNKFIKILSDTVDYSKECIISALGTDGKKQMLISTNLGGNNDIVSGGMFIYNMKSKNEITLLKYFDTGAPEVIDIKNDGNKELLVSDLFYGVMPQASAINFVKEILILENESLVNKNEDFAVFYDKKIIELIEKYYSLKRKVEMGMQPVDLSYPLYREAAEVFVNYYAKGDMKGLRKFWEEEKDSLEKNIPQDEFLDLSNFILKALPSAKNA